MTRSDGGALQFGFIPLTDCAPLIVAQAKGMFAAEGLMVTLSREASWATIRDKVTVGALQGAHMLAPMAIAATLGLEADPAPVIAPLALNANGSAITLSTGLHQALQDIDPQAMAARAVTAAPLRALIAKRQAAGKPALTFAVVFPYSMHNYALRYWMGEAGIDPDRDVRLIVTPPPRMVEKLKVGAVDGFCVGAPWNAVAVAEGLGKVVMRGSDFWNGGPDKVFGVSQPWASANPAALQGVLRALLLAGQWASDPANRAELIALLARPEHVGAAPDAIGRALVDEIRFDDGASFPWLSHAAWFLSQMARWGQVEADADLAAAAARVYRPDLYRAAAHSLGLPAPAFDSKIEGAGPSQRFFDGQTFDPDSPLAYAASFAVSRVGRQ